MKGNIGLTQDIIHNEINIKQQNKFVHCLEPNIISCAKQSHKKYTEISSHKELYEASISEENDMFHYYFVLKNNTNKLLILKNLYLMSEDLTVDEFFPSITQIVHMVKDKFVLNEYNGISLKAINLFSKYDNKYCLLIPIISSYSVMNRFENNPIVVNIETSKKIKLKLLGIFNHVMSPFEIEKINTMQHEYLNTSFKLYKFDINNGNSSLSINSNPEKFFYRSIILIIEEKFKNLKIFLKTSNLDEEIDLLTTPHKKFYNKIAFLITNPHNKYKECLLDYQPQGIIEGKSIDITIFNNSENCDFFVILQQYNIITLST
jgi:hypothetical protein